MGIGRRGLAPPAGAHVRRPHALQAPRLQRTTIAILPLPTGRSWPGMCTRTSTRSWCALEVPGLEKDDFHIQVPGDTLIVSR